MRTSSHSGASRLVASLLYSTSARDPAVIATTAWELVAVRIAAWLCWSSAHPTSVPRVS
jgi:hypothetical protein